MKNDAQFIEKLTFDFKYDMKKLMNVYPTTQKSEDFFLMGCLSVKYARFELEKYRGVISHDTEQ